MYLRASPRQAARSVKRLPHRPLFAPSVAAEARPDPRSLSTPVLLAMAAEVPVYYIGVTV